MPEHRNADRPSFSLAPPPRTLLWDIDGTLVDTTDLITSALDHVYRKFLGKTLPKEELRAIIGIPLSSQLRVFGEPADFGVCQPDMEAEFIRFYEGHRDIERLVLAAADALKAGKRLGRKTGLVTSKNNEEIANTLPRLGIQEFVDVVVSADDVSLPKPDPAGVLLAMKRLEARPEDTMFIGDTVHDMRAGRSAGVRTCAVTWGAAPRDVLMAEHPDLICDDSERLAGLLGLV